MKRALGLTALSLLASCGGGQTTGSAFDPRWFDDGGEAVTAFQRSVAEKTIPAGADVAVGVTGKGVLLGVPLTGGEPWTFSHALDTRPAVAGGVVVGLGGGELFALDALTGQLLWKRTGGGKLRGAGDDGATTVVSILPTTGFGSLVLAIDRQGQVIRQLEDSADVGVPAVIDGFALLPWKGQYVTAYDLHEGEERARILLRVATSRAFAAGGAIFFGETSVTRFDKNIGQSSKGGATVVKLPERALPGDPRWARAGTEPQPVASAAFDRVRLYARPIAAGDPGVSGGRYAATYFRVAIGLDAERADVVWAFANEADFVGGAAYDGGFALCDASGKVTLLNAKGAKTGEVSLGKALQSCVVQADAFSPPSTKVPPPLAEQLGRVASLPGADLEAIQRILLADLAKLDDPAATTALIDLASNERTPPPLLEAARAALAGRRTGADEMLAALGRRYDYLADETRPPPVGPLADALAAMKEKRAAPLLAMHLGEPADPPDDLRRAILALGTLAGPPEIEALRAFFTAYRGLGDPDVDGLTQAAVVSAAAALIKLGAKEVVASAANDSFTHASLRPRLAAVLAGRPDPITPSKP